MRDLYKKAGVKNPQPAVTKIYVKRYSCMLFCVFDGISFFMLTTYQLQCNWLFEEGLHLRICLLLRSKVYFKVLFVSETHNVFK